MSAEDKKIAVIGPSQSGKTCLAVGLFKTSKRNFTIETPEATCCRELNGLVLKFAKGGWPDPTNLGTEQDIRFDFCKKGKNPISVAFLDYAGEKLGVIKQSDQQENSCGNNSDEDTRFKDFANKNFKDLAGVVLLVNPGSGAFQSGDLALLADTMAKYKRVINFLRDSNSNSNNAVVALTITAADRLEGDLSGKLKTFEDSVEELSNSLRTGGFRFEIFCVTVTGRLTDQNRPKLARNPKLAKNPKFATKRDNSASAPFLWILDELKWRPVRIKILKKIWKNVCIGSIITVALALGALGWCLVDANNEKSEIDGYAQTCRRAVEECDGKSKPKDKDLEDTRIAIGKIHEYQGYWRKAYAQKLAQELDKDVWRVHKKATDRAISEIAEKPESEGSTSNCSRVDDLFRKYQPLSNEAKRAWDESSKEWEIKKTDYQEQFSTARLFNEIRKPFEESREKHGEEFIRFAFGLYGKLSSISSNIPRTIAVKEELSKDIDDRVVKEWQGFAIPDFNNKASCNATQDATRDFVAMLDSWKPATLYGEASRVELLAVVSNSVPVWRTSYETTTYSRNVDAAVKSNSMEDMAMFYPDSVAANEFLTAGFVKEQWERCVEPAFKRAYKAYLDGIVAKSSFGRGCPALADDDKNDIKSKATKVGAPFDMDEALKYVEEQVKNKSQMWESEKRAECEKWITDKIRPSRSRTDSKGLWSEYANEKERIRRSNPFFIEIVGTAVYREVEKWFESDVAAFKEALTPGTTNNVPLWIEHDDGNFKIRYQEIERRFNEFKKTCRHVNEDKNPPFGTWAHRFAELCVVKGGVENDINKAFVQHVDAKQLDAMINYTVNGKQKFPVNYKWTSFAAWFEIESFEGNGSPMTNKVNMALIDVDGKHAPKDEKTSIGKEDEGKFKTIWSDKKMLEVGLFQRAKFVARATDYNGNGIKKTGNFTNVISFVDKKQVLELNGPLHIGRMTGIEDAGITVRLHVEMSGETPFSLLEQAKRETREREEAK